MGVQAELSGTNKLFSFGFHSKNGSHGEKRVWVVFFIETSSIGVVGYMEN